MKIRDLFEAPESNSVKQLRGKLEQLHKRHQADLQIRKSFYDKYHRPFCSDQQAEQIDERYWERYNDYLKEIELHKRFDAATKP